MEHREKIRLGLSELYLPYYDALCGRLEEHWQPYSGLRTFDEQSKLYAQGRTIPGKKVTNADRGESAHNYGCATDWTIFDQNDKPIWMEATDKRWKAYETAVRVVGLKWGGHFVNRPDFFHNELRIGASWKAVCEAWTQYGEQKAYAMIARTRYNQDIKKA